MTRTVDERSVEVIYSPPILNTITRPGLVLQHLDEAPVLRSVLGCCADTNLRTLFVQAAGSVVLQRRKQAPGLNNWLAQLLARAHQNVVIVALANKMVRMSWAVLCKNKSYRAPVLAEAAVRSRLRKKFLPGLLAENRCQWVSHALET